MRGTTPVEQDRLPSRSQNRTSGEAERVLSAGVRRTVIIRSRCCRLIGTAANKAPAVQADSPESPSSCRAKGVRPALHPASLLVTTTQPGRGAAPPTPAPASFALTKTRLVPNFDTALSVITILADYLAGIR